METFARYGYRRASMDQVADAAGLTRQALYHHFESKEALFRAVVEALHDGVLQAAAAGGALAEQAGSSLADVLAGQIEAKIRYVIERLQGSPHVEELLSEHQHQAGDLNQRSHEQMLALEVATIERFARTRRLALRDNMSALDLARSIQFALRGDNELKLDMVTLDELTRVVRLIVLGALAPDKLTSRPVKKPRASRGPRLRESRRSR
jgi:AcrR family transcriptional regulator